MSDHDELRREMGDLSMLDKDDPRRQALERRIAEHPWAEREWADLQFEEECLRAAVGQVEPPADLQARLLGELERAVPLKSDQQPSTTRSPQEPPKRRQLWIWTVAAALLLATGIGIFRQVTLENRLQTVAALAISNHLNHLEDHGLTATTSDPTELQRALTPEIPFQVVVPDLDRRFELIGGRKCKLGTHVVALSWWQGAEGECSLFQFRAADFGLPSVLRQRQVRSTQPAVMNDACRAWIWREGDYAFVFVGQSDVDMNQAPK